MWGQTGARPGARPLPVPDSGDPASRGGLLAFLRGRLRRRERTREARLILEIEPALAARLRRAARARHRSPQALAVELLTRGLAREYLRRRTEQALASLTPRQREVVTLAARGQTNRQIAETLVIAPETVKSHLRNALAKLGLHTKAELRLLLTRLENPSDPDHTNVKSP